EELFFDSRSKGSDFLKEGIAFLKERIDEFENSKSVFPQVALANAIMLVKNRSIKLTVLN
ncbi:MAG: hypothetical protein UT01_C0052G0001, partial [Candidatus Daviesbacteria bacterium GW2011_GWA1_38_7]